MTSLFGELKRRNVVRVAVAYAIVGWISVEVSSTVLPIFEAPDWIVQVFTFFVILGFPLALILSWAYEITPEGIKLERNVAAGESNTHVTGRKLDYVIIGLLVLAVGFMFVDNYLPESGPFAGAEIDPASLILELDEPPSTAVERAAPVAEGQQRDVLPNSVAVLPFENLSPDPDNAYFAAGIHEEVLNQLAKIDALNIIARTSMLQYADQTKSIPEIADELNVETVMEGSVRFADDRVLVTVQLIDPVTNSHLWSESYNREFADIFAIQADIAMNIANALEAEFSLEEQAQIEELPTDSPEAYALYLRATQEPRTDLVRDYLDEAIALDPEFALAYAYSAYRSTYAVEVLAGGAAAAEFEANARDYANHALELNPHPLSHIALARLDQAHWRGEEARQGYERAIALQPNGPFVLALYGIFKGLLGEFDEAISLLQRALELDPADARRHRSLGRILEDAGDYAAALTSYQTALRLDPSNPISYIAMASLAMRRDDSEDAIRALELADALVLRSGVARTSLPLIAYYYSRAGRPEEASRVFTLFEENSALLIDVFGPAPPGITAVALMAIGDYDAALETFVGAIDAAESGDFGFMNRLRTNYFDDPVLDTDPRWVEARARLGFDL